MTITAQAKYMARLEDGFRRYGVEGEDAFYAIASAYLTHFSHTAANPPQSVLRRGAKAYEKVRKDESLTALLDWIVLNDSHGEELPVLYQYFLGRRFREGSGKFFTPRSVASAMAALLPIREEATVMDPTCGGGTFLLEASRRWGQIRCRLVGNDVDASLTALAQIVLNLGAPDNHEKQFLTSNIYDSDPILERWHGQVDYILANPPFSLRIETIGISSKLFSLGYRNSDALFLDICFKLLRHGGRLVCLLPHSIVANAEFRRLRESIENSWNLLGVIGMPEGVFHVTANTTTRADIVMLEKRSPGDPTGSKAFFAFAPSVGIPLNGRSKAEPVNDLQSIADNPAVVEALQVQNGVTK